MDDAILQRQIHALLDSQRFAVLATQSGGQPYTSLMAFVVVDGLQTILVATSAATRKLANILVEPRVALLVDNRDNAEKDFQAASSLTVLGSAEPLAEADKQRHQAAFLARHPALYGFLGDPNTVLVKIVVASCILVNRFQEVHRFDPGKHNLAAEFEEKNHQRI